MRIIITGFRKNRQDFGKLINIPERKMILLPNNMHIKLLFLGLNKE